MRKIDWVFIVLIGTLFLNCIWNANMHATANVYPGVRIDGSLMNKRASVKRMLLADLSAAGVNVLHYADSGNGGSGLAESAVVDGSTDTRDVILAADSGGVEIEVPKGTYAVAANLTIANHPIFAVGAKLKPASGVTITLSSGYTADDTQQVFDLSAGGTVMVAKRATVTPQHFGADSTGASDSYAALQAMANCGAKAFDFGSGNYKTSNSISFSGQSNFAVFGSATVTQTGSLKKTFSFGTCTDFEVRGLRLVGTGIETPWAGGSTAYNGVAAVYMNACTRGKVIGCTISNHAGSSIFIDGTSPQCSVMFNRIAGMGAGVIKPNDNGSDGGVVYAGAGSLAKDDLFVFGNDISGHAFGILGVGAGRTGITGNMIHDIPGQHGMYLTNPGTLTANGNTVRNCTQNGIKVQHQTTTTNTNAISISANTIDGVNQGVGQNGSGIAIAKLSTGLFENISVTGNNISNVYSTNIIGNITVSAGVATLANHGQVDGARVAFKSTGTLPAGWSAGVLYYVVSATTNTFSVSLTNGGAAVNTTDAGTGTHTALLGAVEYQTEGYGILIQGCKDAKVGGNRIRKCGYVGISLDKSGATLSDNHISVTQAAGVLIDGDSTVGAVHWDNNTLTDVALNQYTGTRSNIWRCGVFMTATTSGLVYLGNTVLRPQNETPSANFLYPIYSTATVDVRINGQIVNEMSGSIPFYCLSTAPLLTYGTTRTDQFVVNCSAGGTAQTVNLSLIPRNSILQNVNVYVSAAFNGDTTKTLEVGIAGNTDKYIDQLDLATTAGAQATMSGGVNNDQKQPERIAANTQLIATWTNTASATTGKALVTITYTVLAGQ